MSDYYLITCKNDFPPANSYTITKYATYHDIPLRYRQIITGNCNLPDLDRIHKKNEELIFVCFGNDPVDAMIKFWGRYMFALPEEK